MKHARRFLIMAAALISSTMTAFAGVIVLPANEITFNPPLDTLNPTHSGYWWNSENVFEDDTLFAVDTVIQFRYDSLGVGFADPGLHPNWVITNVSLSAKHRAHYWKAKARFIPYVNGLPMINQDDTLLAWAPFKFGSTEMTNTTEITQLDTALADSAWGWDDIDGLSLKYEPRTPNVVYYLNHLYATVTYVDTATADTGHCFEFEPISDPQLLGIPFPVVIYARDLLGNLLAGYDDSTSLSDLTGTIIPTVGHFSGGICSLSVTISDETASTAITVNDGDTTGVSNSFAVVNPGLHHFEFDYITSPQTRNVPFPVSVVASDFFGDTIDAFAGAVGIWDLTGAMTPASPIAFSGGVWSGDVTIDSVTAWDVLTCDYTDSTGTYTGSSNGFEVQPQSGAAGGPAAAPVPVMSFGARMSPNPARGRAEIELQLPREGRVTASIFNILGQEVMSRDLGTLPAGISSMTWQFDRGLNSGVYFLTVSLDNSQKVVRRVSVLR